MRDRVLWLGCLAYAVLFGWLGAVKYAAHRNLIDFGIFTQTVASAFGCFCNPIEGSHWAVHFSPILYLAGAIVALVHTPMTLICLQAVAGALTAPPVYAIVRRARGDVRAARLAALVVWLYPPLAGLIFGDFHENAVAPAAVAWMLYAFDAQKLGWTIVFAALTLAVKEDQALFVAAAGALGAWRFRGTARGRVAAGIGAAGAIVVIGFFAFVQPHAAHAAAWKPDRFYAWAAGDVRALWPAGILGRAGFALLAFVPLLFLPFRSAMMWLAALPLAEVLLSKMSTTYTLGSHYAGAWIGWVLVAFGFAVREFAPPRARTALLWCVALCVVELAVANPMHPGANLRRAQARDVALDRFLATLPPDAGVATQEEAYTHLALSDPYARLLPESASAAVHACFVLVDRDFPASPRLREYGAPLRALVRSGRYVPAAQAGGIVLYRRVGACR